MQHYYSYLLGDWPNDVIFNTEDVIVLREKLKRWSYSYTKETMWRRWEKHEEDVSVLITPEKIKEFDASQASRNAVFILGELGGNTVVEMNPSKYTLVRDYLIAHIMIDDANHAGVVSSMTVEEFQRAIELKTKDMFFEFLNTKPWTPMVQLGWYYQSSCTATSMFS